MGIGRCGRVRGCGAFDGGFVMTRIRWKKDPRPTGLAAVGAGPSGYTLHDGTNEYAHVNPLGGNWSRRLAGWYWVVGESHGLPYANTCKAPCATEQEAKDQARAYVLKHLKARQS